MSASNFKGKVVALSGGVGGAKLAQGLAQCLAPEQLLIVANTGDDFEHLGLTISPDLDSVMYALAGINDSQRGWGLAGESWQAMAALERLGGETWFRLGDRDLATHLQRSQLLRQGRSLTEATAALCRALGIGPQLIPMSDDPVRTLVATAAGELAFQHYFVREQCEPAVSGFRFDGIERAAPNPLWLQWLADPELAAVIICPSNPFVSVDPMLQLPGVRQALRDCPAPLMAVSPIVAGAAIKGPAAKMMAELKLPCSAHSVAEHYGELLDGFVLDEADAELIPSIASDSLAVTAAASVMRDADSKRALAQRVLDFATALA